MLTLLTILACGDKSTEDTAAVEEVQEEVQEQLDTGSEDTAE